MALYLELLTLQENEDLNKRMRVAVTIAAVAVMTEVDTTANHVNRLLWAKEAFSSPDVMAKQMFRAVLAQNASATVAQIEGASDSAIQSKVNDAVNVFASGIV